MIGRLKGLVDGVGDGWVLIDVNGVCYLVEGSGRMLSSLPGQGELVTLAIETYVREDQFRLFGFLSEEERSWFKLLLGVQGVGAKVALAIQSVLSVSELSQAVMAQDKTMVSRAPGVGPKVAQRIVQELKDKVPEASFVVAGHGASAGGASDDAGDMNQPDMNTTVSDALSALTNLGYARSQAHVVVMTVMGQLNQSEDGAETLSTEALIKSALKELAENG
ncbi:MAG: Holliday junction branch migration protein RuvA [Candidatus Micropelagos sp.]|uniref:Holliday junction branch migration complex subunit RuvA n=1 Tax=PS1 clade bacterium TaxID=2175152 RepID=A0A368EJ12_9PROT|nr:Holliday junction branch migration protein RuvA [Hyphomicrobiales bacterium]OUV48295.1 MAG: Holliday junction branch migration protein RuvA [Alphaproteobacteria bacterium TMED110]RCL84469.1 MAG: Holliday junction branch migration protein RuvA [PS1 clade bacterium]